MNIPLKYLLPLLVFITGLVLVFIQTYIQMNSAYSKMIKTSSNQAKVIGNRLASRITFEIKSEGFSKQKMISLTAPYMAETLDQVDLYSPRLELKFSRHISSHTHDKPDVFQQSIAEKVVQDQFSDITYKEEDRHIIGYFPIDFPVQKGEVLSRSTGVLHLVFDMTQEYLETKQSILNTAIMNIVMIIIMVSFFSALMYFLVFKRLDTLHKATLRLAEGNFDVHVQSKGEDELTQVIHTFNSMAVDINNYINDMQKQVDRAVKEQTEQSKMLVQQSRLASMGEMIENIAHQWRQPLNALGLIIQKVELFSQRERLTQEVLSENVQRATTIIASMSSTIDDFRDFFKPNKQMEFFDLKHVVHDVINLLDAGLEEAGIKVYIKVTQPKCEIYGFRNEFAQVILNLINNSKDALIEKQIKDKKVFITGTQNRGEVIFKIGDNAGGIDEGIINRIFEPYYTTKEEGKGTGIGLYMSKMIIEENMHGVMKVKNSDSGAEFSMIFNNKKGNL